MWDVDGVQAGHTVEWEVQKGEVEEMDVDDDQSAEKTHLPVPLILLQNLHVPSVILLNRNVP